MEGQHSKQAALTAQLGNMVWTRSPCLGFAICPFVLTLGPAWGKTWATMPTLYILTQWSVQGSGPALEIRSPAERRTLRKAGGSERWALPIPPTDFWGWSFPWLLWCHGCQPLTGQMEGPPPPVMKEEEESDGGRALYHLTREQTLPYPRTKTSIPVGRALSFHFLGSDPWSCLVLFIFTHRVEPFASSVLQSLDREI